MKIISLDKGCIAFIFGLLLWCSHMHANYNPFDSTTMLWQSTVSGMVSDQTGPLPGVTIYIKDSSRSVVSDNQGRYAITAALGETIVFSFTGFKEREAIVNSTSLDIVLVEDTAELQEVVINAGYYTVKDKERTGSIARITAQDIETQPVTNVLATMQGRMAGVSITQNTGVPGGGFDILIRGQNSLRADGNSPLYVIDGVPYSSDGIGSDVTGVVIPGQISPLNSISPENISSIEILKDADATAIYGSRGANGVVLITTKKGREGKTAFSASLRGGFGKVTRFWDLMNTEQYIAMRKQALLNDGIEPGPADYDVNGTWDQNRHTDWQDYFIGGTAEYKDVQASVTGGSEQTQFLVSGNLHKETTVFPGDFNYKRSNVFSNISHASKDGRFRLNFSSGYTLQDNFQPSADLTSQAVTMAPNAPALFDSEGNLNWEGSTWTNPLASLKSVYKSRTTDLVASTTLSYRVLENLQAKVNLGYTDTRFEDNSISPSTAFDPALMLGSQYSSLFLNTNSRQSWIIEPQLDWSCKWGESSVQLLAGTTFQHRESEQVVIMADGFNTDSQIYNLAAAFNTNITTDNQSVYRYQAVYARANYTYAGRYLFNLTGRRDGSSRFGPERKFANFGAVGAGWIFSKEHFLADSSILSFGKLRGSYGTSGSDQIGDYQFLDTYTLSGGSYNNIPGLEPSRLYNPRFGWEINKKLEAALEMGFLDERLYAIIAFYSNTSSSQLVGIPLPRTTGFASIQANLDATVRNSGWEFTVRSENIRKGNFSWSTSFNLTIPKNELLSFPGLAGSTYRNRFVIGEPLNIRKGYKFEGVDPQTGLYTFKDYNGDGAITAAEDQKHTVDLNPKFFGGLQNSITLGAVRLDFLFQFVKQNNLSAVTSFPYPGTAFNQPVSVLGAWSAEGDNASIQRYTTGVDAATSQAADRYMASDATVTDASFIRLKNVSLSYTVPSRWLKGVELRFMMEAQNLLTITSYEGADPESKFTYSLPPLKVITTGFQLTF